MLKITLFAVFLSVSTPFCYSFSPKYSLSQLSRHNLPHHGQDHARLFDTESDNNNYSGRKAVIVGGGPSGIAAALALEKLGWNDITIVEKRPAKSLEVEKAYLYLIDGRGQHFTDLLDLTTALSAAAVSSRAFVNVTEVLITGICPPFKLIPEFSMTSFRLLKGRHG